MDYSLIIYVVFGALPSLVWLFYYLTKDLHPEPKAMILKVFIWGALITIPVFFIQIGFNYLLNMTDISGLLKNLIYWFAIIAFSEELLKYLTIRFKVVNSPHLDEPLDVMLYMVVAALGFAAVENILYMFGPTAKMSIPDLISRALIIDLIRFVGATFLHGLCSGLIGFSLAISFCKTNIKHLSVGAGIFMAVLLHGLYNFSIMTLEGYLRFAIPIIILVTLAIFVFTGFEKLKKMKSVCSVKPAAEN